MSDAYELKKAIRAQEEISARVQGEASRLRARIREIGALVGEPNDDHDGEWIAKKVGEVVEELEQTRMEAK